jgi:CheY-like chemotaxis protein
VYGTTNCPGNSSRTAVHVVWASSMADAERELANARPDCVLLDLDLPDANAISALNRIAKRDDHVPVVVLTGRSDEHFGVSAVASGAQDYLVKGRVDPETLRRALLYAIERRRAERTAVERHASQLTAQENARLERGLLPTPLLLENPGVDIVARARPNHRNALIGGDFYDFVQTPDRTMHVMVGDVAGHGPDAAALGVALRIGWRALTFAGLRGNERMLQLDRILRTERPRSGIFATVLSVTLAPDSLRSASTAPNGRSTSWNYPRATGWCCSPTACSRGIPVTATSVSAKPACSNWPARRQDFQPWSS